MTDPIAALPGGQHLAALAESLRGNPAALRDLAERWSRAALESSAAQVDILGVVNRLGQTWRGDSRAAFTARMTRFAQAGEDVQQAMHQAAALLRQASMIAQAAEDAITTIRDGLVRQVGQVRAVGAGTALAQHQVEALVDAATAQTQSVIIGYENALGQISGPLGTVLNQLRQGYLSLLDADDFRSQRFYRLTEQPATGLRSVYTALAPSHPPEHSRSPAPSHSTTPNHPTGPSHSTAPNHPTAPSHPSGPDIGPSGAPPRVDGWIRQAITVLAAHGVPASQLNPADLWLIIQHESSGDPNAINNWDANAKAGTPSIGLMQTIGPTFNAYALPGHHDIRNPVDNIIAGTRYALARYGSLDNVPGVLAVHHGQRYVGY